MLLLFYVGPEWLKHGLIVATAGNEILLIAGPALLFALVGRYPWRETFSWRAPTAGMLFGAALLGIGIVPWSYALQALQAQFWRPDPALNQAMQQFLLGPLHRSPIVTIVVVAGLAGICEELLYRGPMQAALLRRLPVGWALTVGGILFAAAHLDLYGLLIRAALGVLLGWIVLRARSVFPAMLAHAATDAASLSLVAWAARGSVFDPSLAEHLARGGGSAWIAQLIIATGLLIAGWTAFTRACPRIGETCAPDRANDS